MKAVESPPLALAYEPALASVPDGRLAPLPLVDPYLFGYLALGLGVPLAGLLGVYNAVLLRRMRPLLWALLLGGVGWIGFRLVLGLGLAAGLQSPAMLVLAGRVWHLLLGIALAATQWQHVRGHRLLGGATLPLLPAVLAGIALQLVLPASLRLLLLGIPGR